jgi:hypothetical protein
MSAATDKLIDHLAQKLKAHGVPIEPQDNQERLSAFEGKLPKRLPQSFESFLLRYSYPAFEVEGISLFAWDSDTNLYTSEAGAPKGSLSELLLPAGYVQIGQPDTGSFDAVCFDLNDRSQNREYRIVQADHESILCNWRVQISAELWPSFGSLAESVVSSANPRVRYDPKAF